MSHFSVLVIGKDWEKQLAPYHEFESTGNDDQYVQTIEVTEKLRQEFAGDTRRMIKLSDGELVPAYDDRFYRDPTAAELATQGSLGFMGTGAGNGLSWTSKDWGDGRGYRGRIRFVPDGAEEVQVPFESFADWLGPDWSGIPLIPHGEEPDLAGEHKYGYALLDETGGVVKVVDRTNPNKKWDWWEVGGRWAGHLGGLNHVFRSEIDPKEIKPTFAVLKDGQWYERGEMGWWGIVIDEEDIETWSAKFRELLENLPPEAFLTVVDCHI